MAFENDASVMSADLQAAVWRHYQAWRGGGSWRGGGERRKLNVTANPTSVAFDDIHVCNLRRR